MSFLRSLLRSAVQALRAPAAGPRSAPRSTQGPSRQGRPPDSAAPSPGRTGASATVQVRADRVGRVRMTYSPVTDGDPDPGEIVWTWVPYEEADGRGKDRPVLVVAAGNDGTVLAVPLTSKTHDDADHVPVGTGAWDSSRRPSWADVGRVLRVSPDGMRREACALDRQPYDRVALRLRERYGWR